MSDAATKNDLLSLEGKMLTMGESFEGKMLTMGQDLEGKIDKAVTDLSEIIGSFAQQVDDRFNKVEEHLNKLEDSHHRLLDTIDGFISRIDSYETEQVARDAQFARLLEWAREVSKKTGIPLRNL